MSVWANSQVKFTVTSQEDGMHLLSVSIIIYGTQQGVTTDFDGNCVFENVDKMKLWFLATLVKVPKK
jgi:hypothetical protein